MNILGLTKTTLLDYPGRVAATVFVGGCNFRCPFCHNREIVLDENMPILDEDDIISFLVKRKNILTGVCITGGEPTLNSDLPLLIKRIKGTGYHIKLDTNGTNPDMLYALIEERQIDYCAMDIKNTFEKYDITCGFPPKSNMDTILENIQRSIDILLHQNVIDYEFRTTIVRELHTKTDIVNIAKHIKGANHYYLQSYNDCDHIICSGYSAYEPDELIAITQACQEYMPTVSLRGVDF